MAYQLEFGEEHMLRELCARHLPMVNKGPAVELRRAYDALLELSVGANSAACQAIEEYTQLYRRAFDTFNRGDLQNAELLARGVKHLCRAAWYDAKIKHLESHLEDLPHMPGLTAEGVKGIEQGIQEVQARLSRLKLTGLADRFAHRARKHLDCIEMLADRNTLIGDTFMKAAHEYCLAVESLHELEFKGAAVAA